MIKLFTQCALFLSFGSIFGQEIIPESEFHYLNIQELITDMRSSILHSDAPRYDTVITGLTGTNILNFTLSHDSLHFSLSKKTDSTYHLVTRFSNSSIFFFTNLNNDGEIPCGDTISFFYYSKKLRGLIVDSYCENPDLHWKLEIYEHGGIKETTYSDELSKKIITKKYYKNGLIHSLNQVEINPDYLVTYVQVDSAIEWHDNGQMAFFMEIGRGIRPFNFWLKSGVLVYSGYALNIPYQKVGHHCEYRENGTISRKYQYHETIPNQAEGKWQWFDANGKVIKWEEYKDGNLIRKSEDTK